MTCRTKTGGFGRADDDDHGIAQTGIDLHLDGEGFNAVDSGGQNNSSLDDPQIGA
ncbi:MAG: hypothetical protein ABSG78_07035 [Verrucomicrobiota bacterium]